LAMTAWLEVAGDAWSTMSLPRWKKAGGTSAREHSPLGRGLEAAQSTVIGTGVRGAAAEQGTTVAAGARRSGVVRRSKGAAAQCHGQRTSKETKRDFPFAPSQHGEGI
jgi:hypothetical protein